MTGEQPMTTPITRTELKRRIENLKEARELAIQEGSEKRVELCDEKRMRLMSPRRRAISDGRRAAAARSLALPLLGEHWTKLV